MEREEVLEDSPPRRNSASKAAPAAVDAGAPPSGKVWGRSSVAVQAKSQPAEEDVVEAHVRVTSQPIPCRHESAPLLRGASRARQLSVQMPCQTEDACSQRSAVLQAALREDLEELKREAPSGRLGGKHVPRTNLPWAPEAQGVAATGRAAGVAEHDEDAEVLFAGRRRPLDNRDSLLSSESFPPLKKGSR